jgi:hypothetical protein
MNEENEKLVKELKEGNPTYLTYLEMPDGSLCCIARFAFTYAILSGLNNWGYEDRWCYHDITTALQALIEWAEFYDTQDEPRHWHRHPKTGRRIDEHGNEYINF